MKKLTDTEKLELISGAILPHRPITRETTLDELNFDSLDAAAVAVMAVENTERGAVEVDERMALGAIAFTARAGRWSATRDRTPLPYKDVLATKSAAYTRARQYLAEGMTHFTVIEGPWTVSLFEETPRP